MAGALNDLPRQRLNLRRSSQHNALPHAHGSWLCFGGLPTHFHHDTWVGPGLALAASPLTSSPGSWLSFGGLPTHSTHARHLKCKHGFWRARCKVVPGSSVSVGGNRRLTLPCSRDLLSICGNPSLLRSQDCANSWEFVHACCFVPGIVREFLGIFYARLSCSIPRIVEEFPGICRSRDWTYRTDDNQQIPRNLQSNYQELCIPSNEFRK